MLVLSRQRDETIMIGDEIEITVVDIRGDKVRLGITAPSRIAVHRKEVYDAIKAENQRASQINRNDLANLRPAISSGPLRDRLASKATPLGGQPPSHPPSHTLGLTGTAPMHQTHPTHRPGDPPR